MRSNRWREAGSDFTARCDASCCAWAGGRQHPQFCFSWNYFLFALVLSGIRTKTAIVASFNFVGEGVTNWGALMAAAVVIALPPLILTILIQKRLVGGLAAGAVKG